MVKVGESTLHEEALMVAMAAELAFDKVQENCRNEGRLGQQQEVGWAAEIALDDVAPQEEKAGMADEATSSMGNQGTEEGAKATLDAADSKPPVKAPNIANPVIPSDNFARVTEKDVMILKDLMLRGDETAWLKVLAGVLHTAYCTS